MKSGTASHMYSALALLAFPCLTPAMFRLLRVPVEPAGVISDVGAGLLLLFFLVLSPRPVRLLLLACWAGIHIGAAELFNAIQRLPVWQDLLYLTDPQFLSNSAAGLHLAAPLYYAALVISSLIALIAKPARRNGGIALTCLLASISFLALHNPVSNAIPDQNVVRRYNPMHWIAADIIADHLTVEVAEETIEIPSSLVKTDLEGERLIPPVKPGNILIIILEGMSSAYLADLSQRLDVQPAAYQMNGLAESIDRAMLIPDFVVHSHQTIRGLYAIHCGDFSKFTFGTPKAFELQLNPAKAAACLPAVLADNGWETHYLQGAPLQFMNKDKAMPAMGFEHVNGVDWFTDRSQNDFIWGTTDHDFFKGARSYISSLQQQDRPWLLSLLTVATHQPYGVSDTAAQKYGSRKMAAMAAMDDAVSSFIGWLQETNILEDTLVIITSDESNGGADFDWSSSWGFAAVLAPDQNTLPRIKNGAYGLVDVEVSVLDYFDIPVPPSVIGRSLFRDYPNPRDMISYTAGKLRWQTAEGELHECTVDKACQSFSDQSIIGPRRQASQVTADRQAAYLFSLAKNLDNSVAGNNRSRILNFADGKIVPLPEKIRNEWSDNLVGAQYLDFPKNSMVRVDIDVTAVSAPAAGIQLQLILRQFEQRITDIAYPQLPVLMEGETGRISFEINNSEVRRAFSFHLVGEGKGAAVRLEKFRVSVEGNNS